METLYNDVGDIDLWVGALAEDHVPGVAVGELLATALAQQFTVLVEGDSFFFLFDPELDDIQDELKNTRLSDIILRNTTLTNIQKDVFHLPEGDLRFASVVASTSLRR